MGVRERHPEVLCSMAAHLDTTEGARLSIGTISLLPGFFGDASARADAAAAAAGFAAAAAAPWLPPPDFSPGPPSPTLPCSCPFLLRFFFLFLRRPQEQQAQQPRLVRRNNTPAPIQSELLGVVQATWARCFKPGSQMTWL